MQNALSRIQRRPMGRLASIITLGLMSIGLAASPARAADPATLTASASGNVYLAGGRVRPAAPVTGDLIAAGGRIIIDQPVGGDAMLAGGSIDLRAPVGDDARLAAGDLNIESAVGGELFASGGNVTLARAARVARSATLYAGSIRIDGKIDGDLQVRAQKIILDGEVGGNVDLRAEEIELGPQARIAGALRYGSAAELKRADGASVGGPVSRIERTASRREQRDEREVHDWRRGLRGAGMVGPVLTFLALLACAAAFLLLFPVFASQAARKVGSSPGFALAAGFGALVAIPVLAVLLFITLVGIPLGIAVLALYPALLLAGYLVGVLFLARRAQRATRMDLRASFAIDLGFFALALLLVMLLSRLPAVGGLVVGVVTVIGIGACGLELYRRRQVGKAVAAVAGDR
jgi:cytoskeletal protein CcmA (bactofilin family)